VILLLKKRKTWQTCFQSGKLPAPARIIQETVVGPTLGKESIKAGFISFVVAFVGVLLYMMLYYSRAGMLLTLPVCQRAIPYRMYYFIWHSTYASWYCRYGAHPGYGG